MVTRYVELRKSSARGTDSLIADIMRHLHARHHLGKAVVLCDQPLVMLSAARKQWLKLSRTIQIQRASTLNADKILKYTHTITRMQHMQFTDKLPLEKPEADVYFLQPSLHEPLPAHCFSLYLTSRIATELAQPVITALPQDALIIDYVHTLPWAELDVENKKLLEENVSKQWTVVKDFFTNYNLDLHDLTFQSAHDVEALEDALDTLLGIHRDFLQMARDFQRAFELARPLRISKEIREQYDSFVLLAHRVQALLPGTFSQHFLEAYNEDDTFFLYDGRRAALFGGESLAAAVLRHTNAGRHHIALALQAQFTPRSSFWAIR